MDRPPTLPLFYRDPVLLRFEEHADVGVEPAGDFGFARNATAIPLCTLHEVSGFYAINLPAFRTLPTETLIDWRDRGWLALVALNLVSQHRLPNLFDLKAKRANQ